MIFGFNIYEKPVEEYFNYAKTHNLCHLEIDLIKDHSTPQTFTEKRIQTINELCSDHAIDVSLHLPYTLNLAERIRFLRKSNIAFIKKCLSIAHQLHSLHVTCHLGQFSGIVSWPWLRKQMLDKVVASLNEILLFCEECKIPLALENAVTLIQGADQHFLGDSVEDFVYLFDKIDSQWLKFCLDIGHANTNDGAYAYIENFADKLINVHFHDNQGRFDDHQSIGDGTVPWPEIATKLKAINYQGPFISECFHIEPHLAAQQFKEIMDGEHLTRHP